MLRALLKREGVSVGRRHVATLMKRMAIEAIYRRPNTSKPAPGHKIYPYLLRGVKVDRPGHVWATDISYIAMRRGFVYLAAVVDVASRRVLAHRVSITMEASFCVEVLEEAMVRHGKPEIFNTDQGSQFTSHEFTSVLTAADIKISMDGKGAWRDNVFVRGGSANSDGRMRPTSAGDRWPRPPDRRPRFRHGSGQATPSRRRDEIAEPRSRHPGVRSTQIPRGAVQTSGATSKATPNKD